MSFSRTVGINADSVDDFRILFPKIDFISFEQCCFYAILSFRFKILFNFCFKANHL